MDPENDSPQTVPDDADEDSSSDDEEIEASSAPRKETAAEKKTRKKGTARLKYAVTLAGKSYDPNSPYWRHILKAERDYLELGLSVVGSAPRAAEAAGVTWEFYSSRLRAHGLSPRRFKQKAKNAKISVKDDTLI